jgi:HEAT repeat protein
VEEDLHDPNPSRRLAAVEAVRQGRRQEYVPTLIEMLDDRDTGVRFAAGRTLEELTGRETGYAAWAPAGERREQVEAWRAWWRVPQTPASPPAPGGGGGGSGR